MSHVLKRLKANIRITRYVYKHLWLLLADIPLNEFWFFFGIFILMDFFYVKSHLEGIYTDPASPEQCLHNSLRIISALKFLGIHYDVQVVLLHCCNRMHVFANEIIFQRILLHLHLLGCLYVLYVLVLIVRARYFLGSISLGYKL